MLRHFATCLGFASSLLLTGQARAQASGAPETGAPEACARIVADAARLACYDRAAKGAAMPDRPPAPAAAAVENFGDYGQLPRDRKLKSDVPKSVTGQITRL